MPQLEALDRPTEAWTLKKSVTALAISPQNESLTRTGRMAFNVMVFLAQRTSPDADGWWHAPVSQIVKGYGATTRDSMRVKGYIEQMVSTLVRYFPLAAGDAAYGPKAAPSEQSSLEGIEPAPTINEEFEGATFTLISEARFSRRNGEAWVTWCFPPTIREMLVEPVRWAQLDLQEMASLSKYASVALYEIVSRYKNVPGGLTNRASPEWWITALRSDSKEKVREWRKFKNETLKPALAEINQRTTLDTRIIEYKKGRAVSEIQFHVRRKQESFSPEAPDMAVVDQAASLGVKERDLDTLFDEYGEDQVRLGLQALEARTRLQLKERIAQPAAYLRRILKNGVSGHLFTSDSEGRETSKDHPTIAPASQRNGEEDQRMQKLNARLDGLSTEELSELAQRIRPTLQAMGPAGGPYIRRLDEGNFRSPLIRIHLLKALAQADG